MPRYARWLEDDFFKLLCPNGPLHFLVSDKSEVVQDDPFAIDVQLREGNIIQYYHGATSLLQVKYQKGELAVKADSAYDQVPELNRLRDLCSKAELTNPTGIQEALDTYLRTAAAFIDMRSERFYRNQEEGWWQNRLALRYSRDWRAGDDWLIIDREAVIGFRDRTEREERLANVGQEYLEIRDQLQRENPTLWGEPRGKSLGNKVDFLAFGSDGELLCIELKYGTNTSGIYWGPLQVCTYRDQFQTVLGDIGEDIKSLAKCKIELGLLPKESEKLRSAGTFRHVQAVLAIAKPSPRSEAKNRLSDLMARFPVTAVPIVEIDSYQDPNLKRWQH